MNMINAIPHTVDSWPITNNSWFLPNQFCFEGDRFPDFSSPSCDCFVPQYFVGFWTAPLIWISLITGEKNVQHCQRHNGSRHSWVRFRFDFVLSDQVQHPMHLYLSNSKCYKFRVVYALSDRVQQPSSFPPLPPPSSTKLRPPSHCAQVGLAHHYKTRKTMSSLALVGPE